MTWGSRACTSSARPAPRMAEASRWMRQLTLEGPKKPSSVAIAACESRAGGTEPGSGLGRSPRAGRIGHGLPDVSGHDTQLETIHDHRKTLLPLVVRDPASRHRGPQRLGLLRRQAVEGPGDVRGVGCEPGHVVGVRLIDWLVASLIG